MQKKNFKLENEKSVKKTKAINGSNMTIKPKSNLEKLKEQQKQLDARIQKLTAAESTRERKHDTRRKILVGSYYLDEVEKNKSHNDLKQKLDSFLTRNSDRALFDLPELEKI